MIETLFRVSCDNPKCKKQQEFVGNIKLKTILNKGWSRIRSIKEEGKWTFLCPKCTKSLNNVSDKQILALYGVGLKPYKIAEKLFDTKQTRYIRQIEAVIKKAEDATKNKSNPNKTCGLSFQKSD